MSRKRSVLVVVMIVAMAASTVAPGAGAREADARSAEAETSAGDTILQTATSELPSPAPPSYVPGSSIVVPVDTSADELAAAEAEASALLDSIIKDPRGDLARSMRIDTFEREFGVRVLSLNEMPEGADRDAALRTLRDYGVPLGVEAERAMRARDLAVIAYDRAYDSLESSAAFAGAEFADGATMVVRVVGELDSATMSLVADVEASGVEVDIDESASYPIGVRNKLRNVIVETLRSVEGQPDFVLSWSPADTSLQVTVEDEAAAKALDGAIAAIGLRSEAEALVEVSVSRVRGFDGQQDCNSTVCSQARIGGVQLVVANSACNGNFNWKAGSSHFLATAGHCASGFEGTHDLVSFNWSASSNDRAGITITSANLWKATGGPANRQDVLFAPYVNEMASNKIRYTQTTQKHVTAVSTRNVLPGSASLCTSRIVNSDVVACTTFNRFIDYSISTLLVENAVAGNDVVTVFGDSGSPVTTNSGHTAVGVNSGWVCFDQNWIPDLDCEREDDNAYSIAAQAAEISHGYGFTPLTVDGPPNLLQSRNPSFENGNAHWSSQNVGIFSHPNNVGFADRDAGTFSCNQSAPPCSIYQGFQPPGSVDSDATFIMSFYVECLSPGPCCVTPALWAVGQNSPEAASLGLTLNAGEHREIAFLADYQWDHTDLIVEFYRGVGSGSSFNAGSSFRISDVAVYRRS